MSVRTQNRLNFHQVLKEPRSSNGIAIDKSPEKFSHFPVAPRATTPKSHKTHHANPKTQKINFQVLKTLQNPLIISYDSGPPHL
jgi:hypothetical protein